MKEFTSPDSKDKFEFLRQRLIASPGTTHVFHDVQLPPNCSPDRVRLGFCARKRSDGQFGYTIYITKNVNYSGTNLLFRLWLRDGDWQFPGYDEHVMFFTSQLKNL